MMLDGPRGSGFTADEGGAFRVSDEEDLRPALAELAQQVARRNADPDITLVEFARSDIIKALDAFGPAVLSSAHVVHVRATRQVRMVRLNSRAEPPRIQIAEPALTVTVSDNHRLPSIVADSIYQRDDFDRLRHFDHIKDRVHAIDNEIDDPGFRRLDEELTAMVEAIVRPYRNLIA
jgi:hypothetical protein